MEPERQTGAKKSATKGKAMTLTCRLFFACLCLTMIGGKAAQAGGLVAAAQPIGVNLYTVRHQLAEDFEGTLRHVAALGYKEVEFVGLEGHDPAKIRALLDTLKLKVAGSQVDWKRLRDDPDGLIAETKALGSPYMIFAWMPPEERQTLAQWRWWTAHMNKVGAQARTAGLRFGYHSHDFEYHPIDGVRPIEVLQNGLDPKTVEFEVDIYWTELGGGNSAALFDRYPGRIPLVHVKDMSKTDGSMVDVGDGRIDFRKIFRKGKSAGLKHYLVEHDNSADPFRTLERSLYYLKTGKTLGEM
jgi:sugar phosphate isomerase/epimerase